MNWRGATVVKLKVLYWNLPEGSDEKRRKTGVTMVDSRNLQRMDTLRHAKAARRSLDHNAVLYLAMRLFQIQ
jgi:hypothetical protein